MNAKAELGTLEASGLIKLAALQPELEYLFRHALVQDAAYGSLLKQERRALHARAAEVLLATYPDRRRELASVIALHLEQAGDTAAAVEHLVVAGEHALERFAYREAVDFMERAYAHIDAADQMPATLALRLRAAVGAAKGGWGFEPGSKHIGRLEELLRSADGVAEPRLVAEGYFWEAFLRQGQGERPEGSPALQRALQRSADIGREIGDPVAHALPQAVTAVYLIFSGQLRAGTALLESVLPAIEKGSDRLAAASLDTMLMLGYARLGEFAAAERSLARAERLAEGGDAILRLDVDMTRAYIAFERGELRESVETLTRCAQDAEDLGAVACAVPANVLLGMARLRADEVGAAKPPLLRGQELARIVGIPIMGNAARAGLSVVDSRMGETGTAQSRLGDVITDARAMGDRYLEGHALWERGLGEERSPAPDHDKAFADIAAAAALFEEIEARPSLARTLRDQARVLASAGRVEEATTIADRATALARELGLRDM